MIFIHTHENVLARCHGKRLLTCTLLVACLIAPNIGCSLLPGGVKHAAAKIGIKSEDTELRTKVESDKFPSAKEAGL
jgi:hypothetical protein